MRTLAIYQIPSERSPEHCEILVTDDDGKVRGFTETRSLADAYTSIRRHGQTWREACAWYGGPTGATERGEYMRTWYRDHGMQPVYIAELADEAPVGFGTW